MKTTLNQNAKIYYKGFLVTFIYWDSLNYDEIKIKVKGHRTTQYIKTVKYSDLKN